MNIPGLPQQYRNQMRIWALIHRSCTRMGPQQRLSANFALKLALVFRDISNHTPSHSARTALIAEARRGP